MMERQNGWVTIKRDHYEVGGPFRLHLFISAAIGRVLGEPYRPYRGGRRLNMALLKHRSIGGVAFLVALVAVVLVLQVPAEAGKKHQAVPGTTLLKAKANLPAAVQVNATAAAAATAARPMEGVPLAPQVIPFRPTMGQEAYQQAKAALAAQAPGEKPGPAGPLGAALAPASPPALTAVNFAGDNGLTQFSGVPLLTPPDTEGAVGHDFYCQIINSKFAVYDKTGFQLLDVGLNDFFGYTGVSAQILFDPQVLYDPVFRRWIVSAEGFPEGAYPAPQYFFLGISQTADPTDGWIIYGLNTRALVNGDFFDYPHLGQDSRSIIVTANNFNTGYIDSRFWAWPKAWLYSGLPFNFIYYYGWTYGTIMPPVVLDTNRVSYLVSTNISGADTKIEVIPFNTPSFPTQPVVFPTAYSVPVPLYTLPPDAWQPGTGAVLDTLDSRFVNASTQIGSGAGGASLFQTHTVHISGVYPNPRYYEFILFPTYGYWRQWDWFGATPSSMDFNASIAANRFKDVFVTFSSTDPFGALNPTYNAQVRFGGRRHFADLGTGNFNFFTGIGGLTVSPVAAAGSADHYDYFRWGDYSAVTIDPAVPSGLTAWITNEYIIVNTFGGWGTDIAAITYLP